MKNKEIIYLSFIICCFGIGKLIPLGDVTLYAVICAFFIEYFGYIRMFALYSIPNLVELAEIPALQTWMDNWIHQIVPALSDLTKANAKTITQTFQFHISPKINPGINQLYPQPPTDPAEALNSLYFMGSWVSITFLVAMVFIYGFVILTVIHKSFKKMGIYRRIIL